MILYGHPTGTRVRIEGKIGTMTNVAPFEVSKTFEITFDDGTTMLHTEKVDMEAWKLTICPILDIENLRQNLDVKMKRVTELSEECGAIASEAVKNEAALNEKYKQLDALYYECCKKLDAYTSPPRVVDIPDEWPRKRDGPKLDHRVFVTPKWPAREKIFDITPDLGSPVSGPVKLATKVIEMLNEENVKKILKQSGGTAVIGYIAEKTDSSAHAVYRFLRKLVIKEYGSTDIRMGKLPEPEYNESDVNVWLEGQEAETAAAEEEPTEGLESKQEVDEREVTEVPDVPGVVNDSKSPEEPTVPAEDTGDSERPQAEEE